MTPSKENTRSEDCNANIDHVQELQQNKLMPKYRIVRDYRDRNTKLSHEKYYIQRKSLWMWNDIDPFDVDSSFYRSGKSWDTFEEAHEIYTKIEEIEALKRRGLEVVWPKPRPEWPC